RLQAAPNGYTLVSTCPLRGREHHSLSLSPAKCTMKPFLRSVHHLFGSLCPAVKTHRGTFRPTVQQLEDRCVPAVTATEFPIPTAASGATSITRAADGNLWFT